MPHLVWVWGREGKGNLPLMLPPAGDVSNFFLSFFPTLHYCLFTHSAVIFGESMYDWFGLIIMFNETKQQYCARFVFGGSTGVARNVPPFPHPPSPLPTLFYKLSNFVNSSNLQSLKWHDGSFSDVDRDLVENKALRFWRYKLFYCFPN